MPVNEPPFNQQNYEQHGIRGRAPSDSPETGNLTLPNNGTIYVTSQHPNAAENGLRFAAAPEVRFEDETYATARYEYQHAQHHLNTHNAHPGSADDIKIEVIRNHNALHGKVQFCFFDFKKISQTTKYFIFKTSHAIQTDSH